MDKERGLLFNLLFLIPAHYSFWEVVRSSWLLLLTTCSGLLCHMWFNGELPASGPHKLTESGFAF
jgi:hypothetical protein